MSRCLSLREGSVNERLQADQAGSCYGNTRIGVRLVRRRRCGARSCLHGPAAWAHSRATLNASVTSPGIGAVGIGGTIDQTVSGRVLGVGTEYALRDNWTAKIEYGMMDFGSDSPFADNKFHVFKAGLNYRLAAPGALRQLLNSRRRIECNCDEAPAFSAGVFRQGIEVGQLGIFRFGPNQHLR